MLESCIQFYCIVLAFFISIISLVFNISPLSLVHSSFAARQNPCVTIFAVLQVFLSKEGLRVNGMAYYD